MIRNFEDYTDEITDDERDYILPRLIRLLSIAIGKDRAIKNSQIIKSINIDQPVYAGEIPSRRITTSQPRIRHMIHVLRVSDTIPFLIANSHGYYISNDKKEIEKYIGSIDDRLRSIYQIRKALKRQFSNYNVDKRPHQRTLIF